MTDKEYIMDEKTKMACACAQLNEAIHAKGGGRGMIVKWFKEHKEQKNKERKLAQIREFCSRCPCNICCPVSPEDVLEGKDCVRKVLLSVVRI